MTNQEADHSMTKAFAAMGGMSEDESEDEETENQSLLAIEQIDKYHFLALVAITEPEDKENNCQIQETIQALMVGLDSEEEEEDKKDQVSLHYIKENLDSYSKRKLESLLHTLINAYQSTCSERDLLMEDYSSLREENENLEQQNCILYNKLKELNKEFKFITVKNEDLQKTLHITKMETEHSMRWTRSFILLGRVQKSQSSTRHGIGFSEAKNPNIDWTQDSAGGKPKQWYLDNACSKHMTGHKSNFLSLKKFKGGNVAFGNGKTGEIQGIGKVGMNLNQAIDNVYYVNGLQHNLLSISKMCDKGNKVIFTTNECKVVNSTIEKLVLIGKRQIIFFIGRAKNTKEALADLYWIIAMQKELSQFERSKVWNMVPRPHDRNVIGTLWVFRNKFDDQGQVTQNKARLVVQGYNQEEGIDYDDTLHP
ncbi:uncharacterized protein LOC125864044 [Solanum stenotomum]|uniref:uncharacterized protein LOC125864044 n=1 Tax=Solanum stenotomum TaxID=172797 RepID=UPI0020D0CCBB|nr:uncharacterized protein LOC125864044 [Solanum stenotomum]